MDLSRQLDEVIALLDVAVSPPIISILRARKLMLEQIIFGTPFTPAERPDSDTWERLRVAVLKRDGYICQGCGVPVGRKNVHHIVPVERGGQTTTSNLHTLCDECHAKIHPWLNEDNHENSRTAAPVGMPEGHR